MANETQIGQLVIDLKIKTEALEKGLETAKKKLQEMEKQNESLKNSNSSLDASFIAMSATAIASFKKIGDVINDCVNEYKAYTQAMSSLSDVADYTEQNLEDLGGIMNKFGAYMTQADLATTIKNFSLMGFTAEQTKQMIEALTNSAIRNRNANYTVSEAVRVASEGYRQGLSTLSDSAGVTENLSVMLDNYAKSIGKTASQLTEAEKNQAYLNRTMYAAQPFVGAMEDYLNSLAGKQGEYSQAMRETQVAYAEALEPTLIKITETKTKLIKLLGDLINSNNTATTGITAFIATLLALTIAFTAGRKAIQKFKQTLKETNAEAKSLKITLGGLITTSAIVAGITVVSNVLQEQKNIMQDLKQAKEEYDKVMNGTVSFDENSVSSMQSMVNSLQSYINVVNDYNDNNLAINYAQDFIDEGIGNVEAMKEAVKDLKNENMTLAAQITSTSDGLKKVFNITDKGNVTIEKATEIMGIYNKRIKEANIVKNISNALDVATAKNKQKEAAELKNNVNQMQNYLNIVKNGDKSTTEYQNAVQALAKAYPEAANAEGIIIEQAQKFIDAEDLKANSAWKSAQDYINSQIESINMAFESKRVQEQVAQEVGDSWENIAPRLQSVLSLLQTMAGYTPTEVPNVTPSTTVKRSSGSSSYSNKALDNYKKEIAHKKALDQLSLQQEISMYEYALKRYAKTADEKNEIRETIYELNKELAQKEKELLEQQTEDYENYMQDVKNARGAAYDVTEQTADYNKIIQMHKNYLNQIMKDERLSLDERKEIYREELSTIRDYEQKKRDLRVEQIDSTVTQLTNAITKQLEEMQAKDKEAIDKNLEEVEKWKEARINAINEEYDSRIEAIEKELEALDKAEQQKSRDEEDAEYERKKNRLQQLIDYEHDATTKANYQKELDKLVSEYQKTLDSRALEDKKEALNAQKELLKDEQNDKTQAIEDEVEKQKELYNNQLDELEKYYDEQINKAQETAEKILLNVEQNQDKILDLLKNYGDAYEITGQTLGEKLAQGINEGLASKIENIIARIQSSIDASIEAQISKIASSTYKYEVGTSKSQAKTQNITINQTNNIEQNPETPSETYRKLRNIDEQLASSLAGI